MESTISEFLGTSSIIYRLSSYVSLVRGVLPEDEPKDGAGCGAPRARFVTSAPGRPGAPPGGTMTPRQELADRGELNKPARSVARSRKEPQWSAGRRLPQKRGRRRLASVLGDRADRQGSRSQGFRVSRRSAPLAFSRARILQIPADPAPVKQRGRRRARARRLTNVIAGEAKQSRLSFGLWIASSLRSSQ